MSETDDEALAFIDPVEDALSAKETVRDMAVGIAFCSFVIGGVGSLAVGLINGDGWYRWLFGVLLGAATAGLMLWHLYRSLDCALDMDADSADKYMRKRTTFRMLMAGAALAVGALFPDWFQVIGVFFGVLCLKFAAYLQPLTHKVIQLLSKGR